MTMKRQRQNDDQDVSQKGGFRKRTRGVPGKVQKGSFEHRFERRRYLNELVQEFQTTLAVEAKREVLGNLANFAYDPYNLHFFQEIGVIPLFLAELSVNRDQTLTEFAIGGICNCVADRRIHNELLRNNGIPIVKQHAYSATVTSVLSAISTLITLLNRDRRVKSIILNDNFHSHLINLSTHNDRRIQNVVKVLLEDLMQSF